jgi:Glu-tRNA(Gln) amidotransferase subunit E-like FAD-binding protein
MDYEKVGFKCGIEIHNRLSTKTKLFCNCAPRFPGGKLESLIKRKMRAVAGEMGQVDTAALYEYLRNRTFFYQCYDKETCLVETDEEPPRSISKEAMEIALQVAKMLKADIPNEIHIMRKTVVDGSNTSGFQRTAIVGMNGTLDTSQGKVGITNVCLEEESSGIVKQEGGEITYRLDRLGIPLIEVGTAPDIKNPEHAKEVAEKLGMIIRSTGKSQRGIGVTRQDINVSISKGARVEIKGVQELDIIGQLIDGEIKRQQGLLERNEKPKEETRIAKEDGSTEFTRPLPGGERMYPETDLETFVVKADFLKTIKIPETWEEKSKKLEKILPKDMINQVLKSEYLDLFERFSKDSEPVLVANTFTSIIKDLRRRGIDTSIITEDIFNDIFSAVKAKKISKEAIPGVMEIVCKENIAVSDAISKSGLKSMSEEQLREIVKKVFSKFPDLVKEKKFSPLMGEVMKEVRGKIGGDVVSKVLNEELKAA